MPKTLVWLARAGMIAAGAIVLYAANPSRIATEMTAAFWLGLLAAQLPFLIGVLIQGVRHAALIGGSGLVPVSVKAVLTATGLNYLIPGQLAEVTKATLLHQSKGVPIEIGLSAAVLGKLLDLIVITMAASLAALVSGGLGNPWLLAVICAGLVGVTLAVAPIARCAASIVSGRKRLAAFFNRFATAAHGRLTPSRAARGFLYTCLAWILFALGVWLFIWIGYDLPLSPVYAALLVSAVAIGAAIPIFPGAIGTYEGAAVVALVQFGLPMHTAIAIAIGLRLSNMAILMPLGLILAWREGVGFGARARRAGTIDEG